MKTKTLLATAAMAVIALSAQSQAAVLLQINDSNPSAVYIDYNGLNSKDDSTNISELAGIDLGAFFQNPVANTNNIPITSGNTTPSGVGTIPYNTFGVDNMSGSYKDLNLSASNGASILQLFLNNQAAFSQGQPLVLDLSAFAANLPGVGSLGSIFPGNKATSDGTFIGTWIVVAVPEPSTYALFGLGALALVVVARRKQTA